MDFYFRLKKFFVLLIGCLISLVLAHVHLLAQRDSSKCGWLITRYDYCTDLTTNRPLVSNSQNVSMWNGTNWVPVADVPCTNADGIWWHPPTPSTPPWHSLYDNGACWISGNPSGLADTTPDTLWVRHRFNLRSCLFYKLTIGFFVDDTVIIYKNPTGVFPPTSAMIVGRGSGFSSLNTVSFVVSGGSIILDFQVISTRPRYIGIIYGIKCEEIQICDSITVQAISTPSPTPDYNCCYDFTFHNPFPYPIPMNIVRFILTNSAQCTHATGPAGWTLLSSPPSGFIQFWNPSGLQPGDNRFTLCFDRNPNLALYLLWFTHDLVHQRVDTCDCKYDFNLYCSRKNCCDSFNVAVKTTIRQVDYNTLLFTACPGNILPDPNLFRFLAFVAYAKRNFALPSTIFDIIRVKSLYGTSYIWSPWQPPSASPNTMLGVMQSNPAQGLSGVWGSHQLQPGFSRELIWGDADMRNLVDFGIINGYCYKALIRITPTPWTPHPILYKFGIRYMFTDTSCCTCDTLVDYSVPVRPRSPRPDLIIIDQENKSEFTIWNHRPIDVEDSAFIILGFDFQLDTSDVSVIYIKERKGGKTYYPDISRKCKVPITLLPGDTLKFEIAFDNPQKLYRIPCKLTAYYWIEDDTIPIENTIIAIYKAKGDEIALDEGGNSKNAQIIALLLRNNNLRKEGISHIIIKPKNKEKIIAVGSDAINMKAQLGSYTLMDSPNTNEVIILPEAFKDAIPSEVEPNEEVKPIYLAFVPQLNQSAEFLFETYNSNYELICEGVFTVPISGVPDDDNPAPISYLTLSPNPVKDNLSISFYISEIKRNMTIKIYDVTGKLIDTVFENAIVPTGSNLIVFPTGHLPAGNYFVRLISDDYQTTAGFVIAK